MWAVDFLGKMGIKWVSESLKLPTTLDCQAAYFTSYLSTLKLNENPGKCIFLTLKVAHNHVALMIVLPRQDRDSFRDRFRSLIIKFP